MSKDFEPLPHTADMKIRVYGTTLANFFRNAVIGMFQSIGPRAPICKIINDRLVCPSLPQHRDITIHAQDLTSLLVDFLSYALYLSDIHNEAYLDATIHEVTNTMIHATVHGITITHFEIVEIKAVTYHDLEVEKINGIWQADIVFDI